jgi:hypothetical protein
MPDPIMTGEFVAGGAAALRSVQGAVGRVVGPAGDEIAEALRRFTEYRLRNVGRIAERAEKKAKANNREGDVHPRVAHRLLEEGSYCDDEVMAEYLGGVLAGSRTPGGRDDRAVAWSDLVTGLSAVQVRAHYLLYREWAQLLPAYRDLSLAMQPGRRQAVLSVPLTVFYTALLNGEAEPEGDVLAHTITGLVRHGLLEDEWAYGPANQLNLDRIQGDEAVLAVMPSVAGIELFGWAQGLPGMSAQLFPVVATSTELDPPLPRLGGVTLPRLSQPESGSAEELPG